jgi:carbonic anhydrase
MRSIKPAVMLAEKKSSGTLLDNAIVENVRRQVAALKRATPIIARDYASKKIDIVGGVLRHRHRQGDADLTSGRAPA